jgi:hypothetical protein
MVKITGYRTCSFSFSLRRKLGDAIPLIGGDRDGGALPPIKTDERVEIGVYRGACMHTT